MAFILSIIGVSALLNEMITNKPPKIVDDAVQLPGKIADVFKKPPPSTKSYERNRDAIKAKYRM